MEDEGESKKYTFEQKIVSAVWVHEKVFNNQSWNDIQRNFRARFQMPSPKKTTLMNWERKLFTTGSVDAAARSGRPCARLMHVPYVKASLEENPTLSLRERAQSLGLPRSTLLKILKDDLNMTFEVGKSEDSDEPDLKKLKRPCYNVGHWKLPKYDDGVIEAKCEFPQNSNQSNDSGDCD